MLTNRSVPADTVLPHLTYGDVAVGVAWLSDVFGFTEQFRYGDDGDVAGAQMRLGGAWIMLNRESGSRASPMHVGRTTQSLTVFVADVDAHYARACAAGARITEQLHETVYGERQYGAQDCEGHAWLFATHVRDVPPDAWGAIVARH